MRALTGRFFGCLVAVAMATAPGAAAQVLRGEVVDHETSEPIPGVLLALAGLEGEAIRQALSSQNGLFAIVAPRPGRYWLRTERLGYDPVETAAVWLSTGDTVVVQLRLATDAVAIDPLHVITSRREINRLLDIRGFYEREELYGVKMGYGTFFGPEVIEDRKSHSWKTTDLLREVSGVRVRYRGSSSRSADVYDRRERPVPIYIDGLEVRRAGEGIDDLIPYGMIGAMEVYPSRSPAQYGGAAAIVIWTRMW